MSADEQHISTSLVCYLKLFPNGPQIDPQGAPTDPQRTPNGPAGQLAKNNMNLGKCVKKNLLQTDN